MLFLFRLPTNQDCHEMWCKRMKNKRRQEQPPSRVADMELVPTTAPGSTSRSANQNHAPPVPHTTAGQAVSREQTQHPDYFSSMY